MKEFKKIKTKYNIANHMVVLSNNSLILIFLKIKTLDKMINKLIKKLLIIRDEKNKHKKNFVLEILIFLYILFIVPNKQKYVR